MSISRYLVAVYFVFLGSPNAWAQDYQLDWSDIYIQAETVQRGEPKLEFEPEPGVPAQSKPGVPVEPERSVPVAPRPGGVSTYPLSTGTETVVPRASKRRESSWDEDVWADTFTVNIIANQDFDTYNNRYRKVARVESLVYRGGYPADIVHCNRASYDSFEVFIDDLEVGDRYQVRVTWDDGSHRTIEKTITESPETQVFVNEPLYFDSAFGS